MSHRKSWNHYQRSLTNYEKKLLEKDIARYIVTEYSLYCKDNGEKVWHPKTEPTVRKMLSLNSDDGGILEFAVNHDYGEVLNRFEPMEVDTE